MMATAAVTASMTAVAAAVTNGIVRVMDGVVYVQRVMHMETVMVNPQRIMYM